MLKRDNKKLFNLKSNTDVLGDLSIIMQIGLTMAGCIIFCFFIGLCLDKWLKTKGIFVTIFIVLGVIGGGNTVYRQIIEIMKEGKEKTQSKDDERG